MRPEESERALPDVALRSNRRVEVRARRFEPGSPTGWSLLDVAEGGPGVVELDPPEDAYWFVEIVGGEGGEEQPEPRLEVIRGGAIGLSLNGVDERDWGPLLRAGSVEALQLVDVRIGDVGGESLSGVSGLRYLSLSATWIDDEVLASLLGNNAKTLEVLVLKGAPLGTLSSWALAACRSIEHVEMVGTGITLYPAALSALLASDGLRGVRLTGERAGVVLDLEGLGSASPLELLELWGFVLPRDAMERIGGLSHLVALDLRSCELPEGATSSWTGLRELERLILTGPGVRDGDLEFLAAARDLRDVRLGTCEVTDLGTRWLEGCGELEVALFGGCPVGDESACRLAALDSLRYVSFEATKIGAAGVACLGRRGSLEALNLGGTWNVDATSLAGLRHARGIRSLSLNGNHWLTVEDLLPLVELDGLERLGVGGLELDWDEIERLQLALPEGVELVF